MNKKRSIWDDPRTSAAIDLAYQGFGMAAIATLVDLSNGQVQYRLRHHGISIASQRRCETAEAKERAYGVLDKYRLPHEHKPQSIRRRIGESTRSVSTRKASPGRHPRRL